MALHQDEQKLVARLIAGDKAAAARFADLADQPVWSTIVALVGDNPEGEDAYLGVMRALSANTFARLGRYDGRASLPTFLVLETRNWLAEQTAGLFARDPNHAWRRFARLYDADFARLAGRFFPQASPAQREDVVQELHVRLIEDNYRRIRAYKGDSAFGGYILRVAKNLMSDLRRQETGRLRLPERIARLSLLHQATFRAGAWRRIPLDVQALRTALLGEIEPDPTPEDIASALKDVAADILAARDALDETRQASRPVSLDGDEGSPGWNVPDPETPEAQHLRAEEQQLVADRLAWALRQADADLRPLDRAYLGVLANAGGEAPPARTIAALLGVPVDEVYGCATRIKRWGARLNAKSPKNMEASV